MRRPPKPVGARPAVRCCVPACVFLRRARIWSSALGFLRDGFAAAWAVGLSRHDGGRRMRRPYGRSKPRHRLRVRTQRSAPAREQGAGFPPRPGGRRMRRPYGNHPAHPPGPESTVRAGTPHLSTGAATAPRLNRAMAGDACVAPTRRRNADPCWFVVPGSWFRQPQHQ